MGAPTDAGTPMNGEASQYLSFSLGPEEYGVEILRVQEIRGFSHITPIPNTPPLLKGVMNLRGTIVPVVDLRVVLGMPRIEPTPFTVIVVVRGGSKVMGMLVDTVSDVLSIPVSDIEPPPEVGLPSNIGSVKGTARAGGRLVVLLDLDRVLGAAPPLALEGAS